MAARLDTSWTCSPTRHRDVRKMTMGPAVRGPSAVSEGGLERPGSRQIPRLRATVHALCRGYLHDSGAPPDLPGPPGDHGWDMESRVLGVRPGVQPPPGAARTWHPHSTRIKSGTSPSPECGRTPARRQTSGTADVRETACTLVGSDMMIEGSGCATHLTSVVRRFRRARTQGRGYASARKREESYPVVASPVLTTRPPCLHGPDLGVGLCRVRVAGARGLRQP